VGGSFREIRATANQRPEAVPHAPIREKKKRKEAKQKHYQESNWGAIPLKSAQPFDRFFSDLAYQNHEGARQAAKSNHTQKYTHLSLAMAMYLDCTGIFPQGLAPPGWGMLR